MTSPATAWQLDRLAASTREVAEIASLGAGVSLSTWLGKVITDTCAAEGVTAPAEPPKILEFKRESRDRMPAGPHLPPAPAPLPVPANALPPPPVPGLVPAARLVPASATPARPLTAPVPPLIAPATAAISLPVTALSPGPVSSPQIPVAPTVPPSSPGPAGAIMLPVDAMVDAKLGTRGGDDIPETLLSDIATRGVRQPVLVRHAANHPEQYEIIGGLRRWRAARRIGLQEIPAIVVTQDDATAILASLGENLQAGDLSVIDEAQAYLRLLTRCGADASTITAAIGRDRKHVVESMRLLGLPPLVRRLIGSGMLSREHAVVLLAAPQPEALADAIIAERLSVEAVRQRIAAGAETPP